MHFLAALLLLGAVLTPSIGAPIPFQPTQTLKGFQLPLHAWSPTADEIALFGVDGLYLLTVSPHPQSPRRVIMGRFTNVAWSPDGRRIAARRQPAQPMAGIGDLIIVESTHRAQSVPIVAGLELSFHDMTYFSGDIQILDDDSKTLRRLGRSVPHSTAATARARGVPLIIQKRGAQGVELLRPQGGSATRIPLQPGGGPSSARVDAASVQDVFPDSAMLLMWMALPRWTTCITDSLGRIRETIQDGIFAGTTVDRSGRLIFGYASRDEGDHTAEEHVLAFDRIDHALHSLDGPQSVRPQASRVSQILAYESMNGGVVIGKYTKKP